MIDTGQAREGNNSLPPHSALMLVAVMP